MKLRRLFLLITAFVAANSYAQNLLENGNFESTTEPLRGWITDYAWAGNKNYLENVKCVTVVTDGSRKVVKLEPLARDGAGAKMESKPFPFEPGYRYICSVDAKGGNYRLYFAGYRWAPGVKPHDNPELGELRPVYQSKAAVNTSPAWTHEKFELPGVKLSPAAMEHLKQVRYLTVYVWFMNTGHIDNVVLTKIPDPTFKLD